MFPSLQRVSSHVWFWWNVFIIMLPYKRLHHWCQHKSKWTDCLSPFLRQVKVFILLLHFIFWHLPPLSHYPKWLTHLFELYLSSKKCGSSCTKLVDSNSIVSPSLILAFFYSWVISIFFLTPQRVMFENALLKNANVCSWNASIIGCSTLSHIFIWALRSHTPANPIYRFKP